MTYFNALRATVCAAALVAGSSATADVTAAQVWDNWKEMLSIYGDDSLSIGSESSTSDSVTVTDLSMIVADNDAEMSADFGDIVFQEQGDGTVLVVLDETYPMSIKSDDGTAIEMSVTQSGLKIIVSGESGAFDYAMSADQYSVSLDSFNGPDGNFDGDIRFTANDLNGQYEIEIGETQDVRYDFTIASMDMFMDIKDPDTSSNMLLSGKVLDLSAKADLSLPLDLELEMDNPFVNGLAMDGGYQFGSASYLFEIDDDGEAVNGTVSVGSGQVAMLMNDAAMGYDIAVQDMDVNATVAGFPFPINVSSSEYGINLKMPLAKTEEPTDFSVGINLTELAVNDEIWMLGDPMGQLPHDPITVRLDLSGTAKVLSDFMDLEQQIASADVPAELHSLTLNDLTLSAAGALITAVGDFTFDNDDFTSIPGIPHPEGEVTVNISGANQLIDSLVGMGLLPEDQAMMGRMMMGMFARTTGDDQLSSKIEINEQGHILANGQRIQ